MNEIRTALICIAKMENRYIRDFVEYYKNLGVTHIFIYDNNDVDGERFEDVINDYIEIGYVTVLDVRGVPGVFIIDGIKYELQRAVYAHCYSDMCNEYDFVMTFDIDEFLTFTDKNMTIQEYLSQPEFANCDVIYVNWLNYGDSGKIYDEPGVPVYERLTIPVKYDNRTWENSYSTMGTDQKEYDNQTAKSIIRTKKNIQYINAHIAESTDNKKLRIVNSVGKVLPWNAAHPFGFLKYSDCDFTKAYLRHYVTKTISEWMDNKMQRGFPDGASYCYYTRYPASFFRHGNEWTIEKQEFIDKFMYENYVKKDGTKN